MTWSAMCTSRSYFMSISPCPAVATSWWWASKTMPKSSIRVRQASFRKSTMVSWGGPGRGRVGRDFHGVEDEELEFGPPVRGVVAHGGSGLLGFLRDIPWVAAEPRAARALEHVGVHAGRLVLFPVPGQHREGLRVRPQQHVGLVDVLEPLDGAAVEFPDPFAEVLVFQGVRWHAPVLQLSQEVHELKVNPFDFFLGHALQDGGNGFVVVQPLGAGRQLEFLLSLFLLSIHSMTPTLFARSLGQALLLLSS